MGKSLVSFYVKIQINQESGRAERGDDKLVKKIVLDMQSTLYAKHMQRALMQDLSEWQPVISESPELTADICRLNKPQVLLMEVTGYTQWMLSERLDIRRIVKEQNPDCRIIFAVEERADKKLAAGVTAAKREGLIDEFIFLSMTDKYLPALLEAL